MNNYYEENAKFYFQSTVNVDMESIYKHFLPLIPPGGKILDAGCGSGRDAYFFKLNGYSVIAIDSSSKLCELSSTYLNQKVHCLCFEDIYWHNEFDAIWACASLLHFPMQDLPNIFRSLFQALKPSGVLYCSFKYGAGIHMRGERKFTDMNEESLANALSGVNVSHTLKTWVTRDLRPDRTERWLNALISCRKTDV